MKTVRVFLGGVGLIVRLSLGLPQEELKTLVCRTLDGKVVLAMISDSQ